jgi:hypothetical protein
MQESNGSSRQPGTGASSRLVEDEHAYREELGRCQALYRVPSMTLTGERSDLTLGSAADPAATPMHGGAIALPDGRVLVNDETHQRTLAIKLDHKGAPHIVQSVASKLGNEAPWTAVDPSFRYYAVTSNGGGTLGSPPAPGGFQTGTEFLNLIDLKTFKNTQSEIPMNNTGEDLTPFFGGRPLTLFAGVGGGEMRAYPVRHLLRRDATPTGTTAIGPNSHGGFSSPETGKIGITTGAPAHEGLAAADSMIRLGPACIRRRALRCGLRTRVNCVS